MHDPLNASDPSGLDEGDNPLPPIVPFPGGGWWPNNFCFSILCSPPPLPPAPDLWNLSVQKSLSGDPAIAPSVTARLLTLAGLAALGQITKGKASSVFQDFIRKQIYSNQHGQGTFGFCACATRQMALKYADIIQLGLSYAAIKQGLWSETSTLLPNPPDWEHYHFNWTVKQGSKPLFSHPDKLGPDAIAQIAQNQSVGTGNTERLRWKPLTVEEARRFLDEGALVAIYVQPHGPDSGHWMAMIRDPFAGAYVYLDPYANTRPDELLTSRSMTFAPGGWDSVFEYHALVHE
jgi:hypothetical protein